MDSYMKLPFSTKSLPKRVVISYVLDYVILILLFIAFWTLDAIEPFHQHFSLTNYTLQYPFTVHERVPVPLLFTVAVLFPAIIIGVYTLVVDGIFSHKRKLQLPRDGIGAYGGKYTLRDRLWEFNCGLLGLILASSSAFVITGALKNATGKPRPDLIARCLPRLGSADPPVFGLSNSTICTQTNHAILKDGFRSFPSGHSSTAFGGLFYLSLYLAGKLHVLDNRGEVWKTFVVLLPTLGAGLIAISRIMDARHHPFDVIIGSLLGVLTAFCAYRQYFPPVSESWRKGRAYPIRSWATEPVGPLNSEREVARDQGVEPMRTPAMCLDEEQPNVKVPDVGPNIESDADSRNVFQQQIYGTDGLHQQEHLAQRTGPSSNYSTAFDARQPSNPFTTSGSRRGRADGYWSASSSEDDGNENGYELQPRYHLNDPPPPIFVGPTELQPPSLDVDNYVPYNADDYRQVSHPQTLTHSNTLVPPVYETVEH